jgi:hypothetical protein
MPYKESKQYPLTNINEIKLEEFHLKFKLRRIIGYPSYFLTDDLDQLFRLIHLFSSSLITLSLNFIHVGSVSSDDVRINGIQTRKSMTKLQNSYFYVCIFQCQDVQQILSTFQTSPWSIGVHENAYLYSIS